MKIKFALVLICTLFLASCGSQKRVRTSKKSTQKKTVSINKNKIVKKEEEKLEATSFVVVTFESVNDYISVFENTAKSNMINYGIPASITLAQGILESGAGKGELCKKANNHFGIKCHDGWEGDKVYHDDDASQECFRKYNHPAESYRDHSMFLTTRSRYSKLFELDKGDYESWAKGLKEAGYATDPKYPSKLIQIIEKYNLHKFDNDVLGINESSTIKDEESQKAVNKSNTLSDSEHEVVKGDTLYSLSKKYNISVSDLKRKNKLDNDALSIGQILKIK